MDLNGWFVHDCRRSLTTHALLTIVLFKHFYLEGRNDMEERLPRKLAAILYADVAGYSRLTSDDEEGTHRLLTEYLEVLSGTIEEHQGNVVHYAGDAVLADFNTVSEALSCATNIQANLEVRNQDLPDERKLQFRIGVNLGEVIVDRDDIYGDGVNIAARLETLADPGGVCISEAARSAVGKKLGLSYEDMGEQRVKNIEAPIRVYRVTVIGSPAPDSALPSEQRLTTRPSVAVLPFKDLGGKEEDDYFAEGITEEIMNALSRFREIVVAARGSSFLVADQALDTEAAASALGVRYVVEGSVRRAGNRVRITTKLVEGATGHQIWSERYDRILDDIFHVQDDVAQKIVVMLTGKIEQADREHTQRKETTELSAYECVLRGRHFLKDYHPTKEDLLHARKLFEQAVERDPRYAAAYTGLASSYELECVKGWAASPETAGERWIEFAQRAIELDENDAIAHLVLSSAYWHVESNFELAKQQLETAIELNPNYYWNYCYGCWFSACAGDLDVSVEQAHEAIRRNPLLQDGCLYTLGFTEYLAGRYENVITTIGRISVPDPESLACLAAAYAQLGRDEDARLTAGAFRDKVERDSMNVPGWRSYWKQYFKVRDAKMIDHLIEGLAKAGLVCD